ncbi:unnamed protein product, partial [Allacma fusca]
MACVGHTPKKLYEASADGKEAESEMYADNREGGNKRRLEEDLTEAEVKKARHTGGT